MREDFKEKIEELDRIGIVRICTDFYQQPNSRMFVKSPATQDKHRSMKLYPATNSFCDYANGRIGGDAIRLVAYVRGIDNWQAMELLSAFYGLSGRAEKDREEAWRKILRQQKEDRRREERKRQFQAALFAQIDDLKEWSHNLTVMANSGEIEPLTDSWCYLVEELQALAYRLDILCAIPDKKYYRDKPCIERGIPSDRPMWLLDALGVLERSGMFHADKGELMEIEEQAYFELNERMPGRDRRCGVGW